MLGKLQKIRSDSTKESGFTIIEVLIVLAIAGLIMVVVFLAIPNLQRSQRNTSRKTDANNILSAVSDYTSNNGGQAYATACSGVACPFLSATSGVKVGYFDTVAANNKIKYYPTWASYTAATPDSDTLFVINGATCATPLSAPSSGTSRQLAAYYGIEGSISTQCISE